MEIVKVKCRKCNKLAKSDELVLDPVYKMMVCPSCVKERLIQDSAPIISKGLVQAGESESFEKIERVRNTAPKLNVLQDNDGTYRCPRCSYKFTMLKRTPVRCPYCDTKF